MESNLNVEHLTVRETASISGAFSAGSTASIAGNATVGGVLTVNGTGNSSIKGPFGVTGAFTASSTANIVGNATVGGALTVNGTGNSSIKGPFGVTGAFTASSTASIAGNATVSGNLQGTTGSFSVPASPMELLLLGVSPHTLSFESGIADKKTVELFSKANWSASSNANWCTLTPASGNGNATPTVNVTENTGVSERTATLTFTSGGQSRTVSVTQPALLAPIISGFIPSEARHSTPLTIFGANFNPTPANNVVRLNGIVAVVTAVTATQLTVTVPKNMACSGKITVAVGSKTATSAAAFDYVPTANVSTIAGNGTPGTGTLNEPCDIAIDKHDNLYVVDLRNHCIRKITKTGAVSTFAGSAGAAGYANGTGTAARLSLPMGIVIDAALNNLYVTEWDGHRIRKVTIPADGSLGVVSMVAGSITGAFGFQEAPSGPGTNALFRCPCCLAIDAADNLYVTDAHNHRVRRVTKAGVVTTIAGSGERGLYDNKGLSVQFNYPEGIAIDKSGNLYVAEYGNHCIRKLTPDGYVTTLAGNGAAGTADGVGVAAQFQQAEGIVADASGNLYVADRNNHLIRRVTPSGVVSTIAGSTAGFANGVGAAAKFSSPHGMAIDASGNLYVADRLNHRIRKIELE